MSEPKASRSFISRGRRANVRGGRVHAHQVKVSPEEEGALLLRAKAQGVTIPRLLVESALAEVPRVTAVERRQQIAELHRAYSQLAAVGNNLNQIARFVNAEASLPAELRAELSTTMEQIRRIAFRVDEVTDRVADSV